MDPILASYGYSPFFVRSFESLVAQSSSHQGKKPRLEPARVVFASREHYRLLTSEGEREAKLGGRFRSAGAMQPAVGDWLAISRDQEAVSIHSILSRRTCLSRKVPGEVTREQVVAANVDSVFLVMGVDGDFNLRRLERFAVLARESGAEPIVVLTKADLRDDAYALRMDAQQAAPGLPVHLVSSLAGEGLEPLKVYLQPGQTVALLGSSGVGKSTLLNRLCDREVMRTGGVRESDDRGRHTTTHRELVLLPGGGLLIDNPGVREIQLWAGEEALSAAFEDIESLASRCKFRDCQHVDEPACAVLAAVACGELDEARLESWHGLARELAALERRRNVALRRQEERTTSRLYRRVQAEKQARRR